MTDSEAIAVVAKARRLCEQVIANGHPRFVVYIPTAIDIFQKYGPQQVTIRERVMEFEGVVDVRFAEGSNFYCDWSEIE